MDPALLSRHLLLALAVIVGVAHLFGWLAERLHQPRVLGEMVDGVVVGPSALRALFAGLLHVVLPPDLFAYLKPLSELGVVLFMFLVGMAIDLGETEGQRGRAVAISHASILLPLVLGTALGAAL